MILKIFTNSKAQLRQNNQCSQNQNFYEFELCIMILHTLVRFSMEDDISPSSLFSTSPANVDSDDVTRFCPRPDFRWASFPPVFDWTSKMWDKIYFIPIPSGCQWYINKKFIKQTLAFISFVRGNMKEFC